MAAEAQRGLWDGEGPEAPMRFKKWNSNWLPGPETILAKDFENKMTDLLLLLYDGLLSYGRVLEISDLEPGSFPAFFPCPGQVGKQLLARLVGGVWAGPC